MEIFSADQAVEAHRRGDLTIAEAGYRALLARGANATASNNLGVILKDRGDFSEAEAAIRAAIEISPENAGYHYNLGKVLFQSRRPTLAVAAFREAQKLAPDLPDLRAALADALLVLGETKEGWELYDFRRERLSSPLRGLPFPEWRGEDLAGKSIYVRTEQGFGDEILVSRYFSALGASSVTVACQDELMSLFSRLGVQTARRGDLSRIPPHDYWSLSMSLPRWCEKPKIEPYLFAKAKAGSALGMMTTGSAIPDPGRSLPREAAALLLATPGAIDLDPRRSGAQDFQETAEIIAGVDAVITVDTSVAHLAGALGKRCIVLLQHFSTDWRWDQPWYVATTCVRQPAVGDWPGAIELARRLA